MSSPGWSLRPLRLPRYYSYTMNGPNYTSRRWRHQGRMRNRKKRQFVDGIRVLHANGYELSLSLKLRQTFVSEACIILYYTAQTDMANIFHHQQRCTYLCPLLINSPKHRQLSRHRAACSVNYCVSSSLMAHTVQRQDVNRDCSSWRKPKSVNIAIGDCTLQTCFQRHCTSWP